MLIIYQQYGPQYIFDSGVFNVKEFTCNGMGRHNLVIETCTHYWLGYNNACIQCGKAERRYLIQNKALELFFVGVRCIYMLQALNIKRLDFIGFMEVY